MNSQGHLFCCSDRNKQGFSLTCFQDSLPFFLCSLSLSAALSRGLVVCMHSVHAWKYALVYCAHAENWKPVSCAVFDFASNKRRAWFLRFFFFPFSKLGHELYGAASNYQPCGRIEGKRSRNLLVVNATTWRLDQAKIKGARTARWKEKAID